MCSRNGNIVTSRLTIVTILLHLRVCVFVFGCVRVCVCACVRVCVCACVRVCVGACVHGLLLYLVGASVCVYVCVCVCVCVFMCSARAGVRTCVSECVRAWVRVMYKWRKGLCVSGQYGHHRYRRSLR